MYASKSKGLAGWLTGLLPIEKKDLVKYLNAHAEALIIARFEGK